MDDGNRLLLSGDEAVALAAWHAGVALGTGYPGTPSTEILETFLGAGRPRPMVPNEKVALEVAIGAAFGGRQRHGHDEACRPERRRRSPLHRRLHRSGRRAGDRLGRRSGHGTPARTNRTTAATPSPPACPCSNRPTPRRLTISPSLAIRDFRALELARSASRHHPRLPHSKTVVCPRPRRDTPKAAHFDRDIHGRVMIPSNARPAHRRLRQKLAEMAQWNEACALNARCRAAKSPGHRHLRHFLHARSRSRAGRRRAETGPHLSAAA